MEDLIYILAGVAYLAYSIYSAGQKQKKKKEQALKQSAIKPVSTEPVPEKKPTTSIFDEILGFESQELNIEKELFGEQETVVKETKPTSEPIDVIPEEEGIRTTKIEKKQTEEKNILLEEEADENEKELQFDLKQAVILSEILNPPYIER